MATDKVLVERVRPSFSSADALQSHKPILIISINRPEKRNAVDSETAHGLYEAFVDFDKDPEVVTLSHAPDGRCQSRSLLAREGTFAREQVTRY